MSIREERYKIRIKPGNKPEEAAMKMSKYIVDRYLPGHAGGALVLLGPGLSKQLLPFFHRPGPTMVEIDSYQNPPAIREVAS